MKISFESIPWENPKTGVYQKIYSDGEKRIRLLRFVYEFVEEEWCRKGHIGYVLKGNMTIVSKIGVEANAAIKETGVGVNC